MAIPSDVQEAIDRLPEYNSRAYKKDSNPYSFDYPGSLTNFPQALADAAKVVNYGAVLGESIEGVDAIAAEIQTVASISTEIETVAGDSAYIVTVAGISTEIETVAARDADIATVAARDADIGTVADREADIGTLADIEDGTTATGAIQTVAGISGDVSAVATIDEDVTTAAANITAIQAAPQAATDAANAAATAKRLALYSTYKTATGDADPGAGNFRLDAAVGSATQMYVSTTAGQGGDVTAWLDTWDDSTSTVKGSLVLVNMADRSIWATYQVSSVTSATGYRKIGLTHVASNGSFSADDEFALEFKRAGDKGTDGAGSGDVVGPASATDANIATFDGATGKLIQDGGVAVSGLATAAQGTKADSAVQPGDNVSDLTNDSGFITGYTVTEADVTQHEAALTITESQIADLSHFSGVYDDLTGKPTIPSGDLASLDTIDPSYVQQATDRILGRVTSGTGDTEELTAQQVLALLNSLVEPYNLTSSATVSINWTSFVTAKLTAFGNRTLGNPTNVIIGTTRTIYIVGDDATENSLSFGSNYAPELPSDTVTSTSGLLLSLYAVSSSIIVPTWKVVDLS